MSPDDEDIEDSEEAFSQFVPAVFARSSGEAEKYRELLEDHDIPALVGGEDPGKDGKSPKDLAGSPGVSRGVPVLVPEVLLDEASEVIADREDLEEFEVAEDSREDGEDEDEEFGLTEHGAEEDEVGAEEADEPADKEVMIGEGDDYDDDEEEEEEEF